VLKTVQSLTTPLLLLAIGFSSACESPCIHMCQQYERYLDRCGYGWSTVFRDRGWDSIEDCYDDHWEADEGKYPECQDEITDYEDKACY